MSINTFIIAEIGVNHNADLSLAFQMIDAAVSAGADAVKFQAAIPELVATRYAEKAVYQKGTTAVSETQLDMIKKVLLPLESFKEVKDYCDSKNIEFFSTAFDAVSLAYLEALGQRYHKISSGEITNLPFLRKVAACKRPTLMSTGMANLGEIEAALDVLEREGLSRDLVTVLHCTTEYPTPFSDVNLYAMNSLGRAFGVKVGYSDHTTGIEVPIAAVALGATVIEKHFTLDKTLPGPDHQASLEPSEFLSMVCSIRNIEKALGDGIKRPSASEIKNIAIARRSLVASRHIVKGEPFGEDNITAKRPGTGVSPMRWPEIMGRVSPRDFKPDELIEW